MILSDNVDDTDATGSAKTWKVVERNMKNAPVSSTLSLSITPWLNSVRMSPGCDIDDPHAGMSKLKLNRHGKTCQGCFGGVVSRHERHWKPGS